MLENTRQNEEILQIEITKLDNKVTELKSANENLGKHLSLSQTEKNKLSDDLSVALNEKEALVEAWKDKQEILQYEITKLETELRLLQNKKENLTEALVSVQSEKDEIKS